MTENNLLTLDGFIARYFHHLKSCRTNESAYEKTAEEYRELYGIERYSSYESFRKVKNRKLKQN